MKNLVVSTTVVVISMVAAVVAALVAVRVTREAPASAPTATVPQAAVTSKGERSGEKPRSVEVMLVAQESAPTAPQPVAQVLEAPEQGLKRLEQAYAEAESTFVSEAIDEHWSERASNLLHEELLRVGYDDGFEVVEARCRSTSCKATLRWTSYDEAVATDGHRLPQRILRDEGGLNCTKSIWLREPLDTTALYTADLYLDCTDQRSGRIEPMKQELP